MTSKINNLNIKQPIQATVSKVFLDVAFDNILVSVVIFHIDQHILIDDLFPLLKLLKTGDILFLLSLTV